MQPMARVAKLRDQAAWLRSPTSATGFPMEVIRQAVWLYFRFPSSLRDVEALLAERGIVVSHETIRCWAAKFGSLYAANLRRSRSRPTGRWHLDEMAVKIAGQRMWLWRAVDDE